MEENKDLREDEIIDDVVAEEVIEEVVEENEASAEENQEATDDLSAVRKLKDENSKLNNEVDALKDRLLRLTAEYENYRRRSVKEKEGIYTDACADVIKELIPALDNLERAMAANGSMEDLKKGIDMTIKGFENSLQKLNVEEIDTTNGFNPELHQAISMVDDENLNSNDIAQVFQKGYKRGDKVIRYSMVTVAK